MKKLLLIIACGVMSLPGFSQCFNAWTYYEPITITNNNPAQTDFQVSITMNTAALIAAGKMNAAGNDIRIVEDLVCCTALPHYVQSGINTAATNIWVKVNLPANTTKTIYIRYGNSAATNNADPENVFALWEGYDGPAYDFTLACGSGTATAVGGQMTYSWPGSAQWVSNTTFPVGSVYTAEANVTASSGSWPGVYWAKETAHTSYALLYGSNAVRISLNNSSTDWCAGHNWASTVFSASTTPGIWSFTWMATGSMTATHPGYGTFTGVDASIARDQNLKLTLGGISSGSGSYTIDWIRARKYAPNAPTASVGAEVVFAPTTISYTGTLCAGPGSVSPTVAGVTGGTYSAPGGVSINATTGAIDLGASTAGTYTITYNIPSVICPGTTATTSITITQPTGAIAVNGSNPICAGQSSTLIITGQPNSSITYNVDGINPQTVTLNGAGQYPIATPALTANSTYNLVSGTLSGCTATLTGSATVTVNALPTATLTNNGAATICSGATTGIDINFTGTPPFNFNYFNGTTMVPMTGWATNTFTFAASPTTTTTYFITGLSNTCTAEAAGMADNATVTVEYAPAITTQPLPATECAGGVTAFAVAATGGGLTYQWYNGVTALGNTAPYSGAFTDVLNISNTSGLDGNTYHVVVTNGCGSAMSTSATLTEDFTNTWDGSADALWSNIANWSCGIIPIATTNVVIPATATNMPDVNIPGAICNNLTIDAGADIEFTGANNQLEVRGDITNDGDFDGTLGKVLLAGTAQELSGPFTFGRLEIAGGGNKTLTDDITVTSVLTLTNGTLTLDSNNLTLNMPWVAAGGSATSFIVTNDSGAVIGTNMGTGGNPDEATFHVGISAASYTPVTLENTGIVDTFTVRVIENVYEDGYGVSPDEVTNPVVNRTWMISENTPGGSFAKVTPQWNLVDQNVGFDQNHVYVVHYMNNEWTSEIDSAIWAPAANGTNPFWTMEDSITSFSPFAVASAHQFPLAIRLTTISAANAGARNKVEWKSATEAAGDHYELERSSNGTTFTQIATIKANGKASTYTHFDESPVTGVNYYRAKLVDANGKANYSKVVSATVKANNDFNIEAYPNPVKNTVSVKVNGTINGKGNITITDVTGRVVKAATDVANNKVEINVSNLASGMYLLNYTDDVRNESIKINKQ